MSCYTAEQMPTVADLVRRHGLELVRFAYLLCGDRFVAEDLVQEVVLQMYRRFPAGLTLDKPVAYARRAVANANISRARRASSTEIAVALVPERVDPGTVGPDVGGQDDLWDAVRRLPQRQRAVLVLRFYADASDEEIAESLGCRRGTVRSLASRALAALRADPTINYGDACE
jgi:RNA polymerase sigma-70 factor (sigma-E family)